MHAWHTGAHKGMQEAGDKGRVLSLRDEVGSHPTRWRHLLGGCLGSAATLLTARRRCEDSAQKAQSRSMVGVPFPDVTIPVAGSFSC